jgi:hypothetical protein
MRTLRSFTFAAVTLLYALLASGCSSVRVTDPARTATEMLLLSQAATKAINQLSAAALRDRRIYLDDSFFLPHDRNTESTADYLFILGEVRAKLLLEGARLMPTRQAAEIVVELRSGAHGIDKQNLLVGLPSIAMPGLTGGATGGLTGGPLITTPEIALLKNIKQDGVASVAIVAYWADSGELVATSGPFVGRTFRDDWWFLGYGPRTTGDIPTAQQRSTR